MANQARSDPVLNRCVYLAQNVRRQQTDSTSPLLLRPFRRKCCERGHSASIGQRNSCSMAPVDITYLCLPLVCGFLWHHAGDSPYVSWKTSPQNPGHCLSRSFHRLSRVSKLRSKISSQHSSQVVLWSGLASRRANHRCFPSTRLQTSQSLAGEHGGRFKTDTPREKRTDRHRASPGGHGCSTGRLECGHKYPQTPRFASPSPHRTSPDHGDREKAHKARRYPLLTQR